MAGHLFLLGFMGAGKSTVGLHLALRLNCPFVDLDLVIADKAGKSIPEVFAQDGEAAFRKLESALLQEVCAGHASVVSTGGGVIGCAENRDFMRRRGTTIYLQASWQTLRSRLGSGVGRPLAGGAEGWTRTHALWLQRCPLYEQADLIIPTDGISVQAVVENILVQLKYAENE